MEDKNYAVSTAGKPAVGDRFSLSRNELFAALSKAQAQMSGATKGSENPFFKSKYADLHACQEAIRQPFAENNLCVVQTTSNLGGSITVETTLGHASGQWMIGTLTMTPEKAGPQALGACITYARRYALAAIAGLAQADDDAEGATIHRQKGKKAKAPEKALPAQPIINKDLWLDAEKAARKGHKEFQGWYENGISKADRAVLKEDSKRFDLLKERSNALSVSGVAKKLVSETAA